MQDWPLERFSGVWLRMSLVANGLSTLLVSSHPYSDCYS
jgi:hypothetical protein